MAIIFRKHEKKLIEEARKQKKLQLSLGGPEKNRWAVILFFIILVSILLTAASTLSWVIKGPIVGFLLISLGLLVRKKFERDDVKDWWFETWDLSKKIVPVLVIGAFIVGIVAYIVPPENFQEILGNEGLTANFLASVIGALLYMPTLLEVPIIGETFGYTRGLMGSGPALSLLLAGPAVSLPNMIVLNRIMGLKKTFVYILLVIVFSTMAGLIYGNLIV